MGRPANLGRLWGSRFPAIPAMEVPIFATTTNKESLYCCYIRALALISIGWANTLQVCLLNVTKDDVSFLYVPLAPHELPTNENRRY